MKLIKYIQNTVMLFEEYQYLGTKHTLLSWLYQFITKIINAAIDAFAGSQSVRYLLKQQGCKVITNDFLNFNNQIGKALIENKSTKLDKTDLDTLFHASKNKNEFELFKSTFTNVFFEKKEAQFLDNFRANIPLLENELKQALAFTVINNSMTRKITMGILVIHKLWFMQTTQKVSNVIGV
ncbi:DNA adenine methylase [Flavobacterium branchiophilum]|uniref:DNA adenine methylase n=1 Tax=Flavobacterium branchiophilum TaxID=55197 RepID=UPI001CBC0620|nr:DNA adenine methylase [Flavobacterium branchiophilum]